MGWDKKKRGPASGYYYKSIRTPGKPYPTKVYCGRGAAASAAAAEIETRKHERQRCRDTIRAESDATAEADYLSTELQAWVEVLAATWLIVTNHHRRRGEWRLKRGRKT